MSEGEAAAITPIDSENDEDDEDYDVVDASSQSKGLVQQVLTLDLSQQPTYTQALVGGATGWVSGFALGKVGKALAFALGGSLLLVHAGNKAGYITVDWDRLDKDMKEAQSNINKRFSGRRQKRAAKTIMRQGTKFLTRNMVAIGGFLGGFLLGMAA